MSNFEEAHNLAEVAQFIMPPSAKIGSELPPLFPISVFLPYLGEVFR